jgi:hypothetical protein
MRIVVVPLVWSKINCAAASLAVVGLGMLL